MKDVLAPRNLAAIRRFAAGGLVLAFDYDGTLAPIVDEPARAAMREATRGLLARVAHVYPCAVISGRQRSTLARHVAGVGVKWIVGNHGQEWGPRAPGLEKRRAQVAGWRRALGDRLADLAGVAIEDKRYSLSVHYRHARRPEAARRAIAAAVEDLPGCRAEPGLLVVNLLPRGAPDKGDALRHLLEVSGCRRAIFVGDDASDEAAFALGGGRVLGIRVGPARGTRAEYGLDDQRRIDGLLRLLYRVRFEAPKIR